MDRITNWVFFVSFFLFIHGTYSVENDDKSSLIKFLEQLSNHNGLIDPTLGWNMSSDPCTGGWKGVMCNTKSNLVKNIVLEGLNLAGTVDANSLCAVESLRVLSLINNSVSGQIPIEIGNCKQLTHIYLSSNQFEGSLPDTFSSLSNLKRLDIANNKFSGSLPDLARISGLVTFLAENNQLSGNIPQFDFSNLQLFNVSFNNFSGPIPDLKGRFTVNSLMSNPGLCGQPLPNACPSSPPPPPSSKKKSKKISTEKALMYAGYVVIGLLFLIFVTYRLVNKGKDKEEKTGSKKGESVEPNKGTSSDNKNGTSRSEYSITSAETSIMSTSLTVLATPMAKQLRFEDLLKAPAELLGRGRYSSLYKVAIDERTLAVKRLKDWIISRDEFKKRMQKIDQVKHMNVLPAIAFYCSKQEKLLVYEFQQNGSLFKILHETKSTGKAFDWESRLNLAASISYGLAFMHDCLREDEIAHGNLKSSNILFNEKMEPCVSEYGLMEVENQGGISFARGNHSSKIMDRSGGFNFKVDIYAFGVILLELLTGKVVQSNGSELARWVHSVVKEEWTAEVFDRALVDEGANEERMVQLLQVALKCIDPSPEARISMNQVAIMINSIKDEEERSTVSDAFY